MFIIQLPCHFNSDFFPHFLNYLCFHLLLIFLTIDFNVHPADALSTSSQMPLDVLDVLDVLGIQHNSIEPTHDLHFTFDLLLHSSAVKSASEALFA